MSAPQRRLPTLQVACMPPRRRLPACQRASLCYDALTPCRLPCPTPLQRPGGWHQHLGFLPGLGHPRPGPDPAGVRNYPGGPGHPASVLCGLHRAHRLDAPPPPVSLAAGQPAAGWPGGGRMARRPLRYLCCSPRAPRAAATDAAVACCSPAQEWDQGAARDAAHVHRPVSRHGILVHSQCL